MNSPFTENRIINQLNLKKFEEEFPVPSNKSCEVIELNYKSYSLKAVKAGLNTLSKEEIQDLLKYPYLIIAHNNLSGLQSAGGEQDIYTICKRADYELIHNHHEAIHNKNVRSTTTIHHP